MNNPQTQMNPTVIQQNLIQASVDKAHRSNASRSSRRNKSRDRYNKISKSSKSRRSRSRDRDRKKERRTHYDRNKRDRKESRKESRKERDRKNKRDLRRLNGGILINKTNKSERSERERKRRRSPLPSNNRKSKHSEESRRKRRKLNNNKIENGNNHSLSNQQYNVTFDTKINDNINAVKDIKNLVSNSKNKTNIDIANIPAVLQDKKITAKTLSAHGTRGNVTTHRLTSKTRSKSRSGSDASSYSGSDVNINNNDPDTDSCTDNESENSSDGSSSYSGSDSDYTTDSNSSSEDDDVEDINTNASKVKANNPALPVKIKRDHHVHRERGRDRERRQKSKHHHDRDRTRERRPRDRRVRDRNNINIAMNNNNKPNGMDNMRRKTRGRTPNWLDHQEKEWFKAMEMLTKFNHRKNYRDKFLQVFEGAVYSKFEHFWHNNAFPTAQDLKALESIFEKSYFEHFNSIRQVREYQQNMQRQQNAHATTANIQHNARNNNQAMMASNNNDNNMNNSNSNNNSTVSSYPQVQNIQNRNKNKASNHPQIPSQPTDLLSMLNLGDDLNANIQNIQALLAMSAQQQQPQQTDQRRTLRVPSRLQQNNNNAVTNNANIATPIVSVQSTQPKPMQMRLQPPTVRKPAALRPTKASPSPLPVEIVSNNAQIIALPPPNNSSGTVANHIPNQQELPTPEPVIITKPQNIAPPPISQPPHPTIPPSQPQQPTAEIIQPLPLPMQIAIPMAAPTNTHNTDINVDNDNKQASDEQICHVLHVPPPPKDPRRQLTSANIEKIVENNAAAIAAADNVLDEAEEDADILDDENMSVMSDVVTEDDIIISSPVNNKKDENDSTNSMSPEVPIDKSRISNSAHITAKSVPNEDDIDFETTLNTLGDFLSNDNQKKEAMDVDSDINVAKAKEAQAPEMKTNSTNVAAVNAMIGIETGWLFSDESDLDNNNLPGMSNIKKANPNINPTAVPTASMNASNTAMAVDGGNLFLRDTAPSHFIPAPSYYNPPAPGQDVDRRVRVQRNNANSDMSAPAAVHSNNPQPLQPKRRAVRRRKVNPDTLTEDGTKSVSPLSMHMKADLEAKKPKTRVSAKKRGFFNRIRARTPETTVADKHKMIKSRINRSMNNVAAKPSSHIVAGFPMNEAKQRRPAPRSFSRVKNLPPKKDLNRKKSTAPNRKITSNAGKLVKKRNKNLIPKSKDASPNVIDLTANHRVLNNKSAKTRVIRKQALKSKAKTKPNTSNPIPSASLKARSKSKSRSITPSATATVNKNKRPINSKSNMPLKKISREAVKRPQIKGPTNMGPSKGRHYQELGPRLAAPPTDLSALFDENPNKNKKKADIQKIPVIANNPKPKAKQLPPQRNRNNYYDPRDPRGPPPGYPPPPTNGQRSYYPPPPNYYAPPPNGYYGPPRGAMGAPPPYYHGPPPPNGYYPPAPYAPQPPPHGMYRPPQPTNNIKAAMPEPDIEIKYKKIAKYRDNVFFPEGYKKWTRQQHMDHIDNSIHERTKLLLFLDIDHTILHSTRDKRGKLYLNDKVFGSDIFEINFPNQYNASYYVKFRPSFRAMIRELSPIYDFVLYTMGSRCYAEQVAMVIDEHFRKYIPCKSSEKHNKTFIVGNRIICREDHGSISDKDYKKDVAQFAPISGDWCVTMDDVPEVWKNRDDIHRVPKYLFWPNPDKTAPGTTHKHQNDDTNNKINIWSKNSITKWNDNKSLLRQEKDSVLLQCIEIAKAVHECYYSKYTPNVSANSKSKSAASAPKIFNMIRSNVMKDSHLAFTGVFPQRNARNDFHWKLAQLFGANVSEIITNETTHLIGKDSKTSKIQQAIKDGKIEIVHVNWLYQTLFNFGFADCNRFRMFKNGDDKHTPPMVYNYIYFVFLFDIFVCCLFVCWVLNHHAHPLQCGHGHSIQLTHFNIMHIINSVTYEI